MGRFEAKIVKLEGYKFVLEMDLAVPSEEENLTCWIYFEGEPLMKKDNQSQVRKYFVGNKFNASHFFRFCNKFVEDKSYREKYL